MLCITFTRKTNPLIIKFRRNSWKLAKLYLQMWENAEKPTKLNLGTPNVLATSPVHGWHMSDMMQFGGGPCSLRYEISGSRSCKHASKNALNCFSPSERVSRFSDPSGRPSSPQLKGSVTNRIESFNSFARSMTCLRRDALRGVVTKVTSEPWFAIRWAKSTMGIMWPCAKKGTNTKWGCGVVGEPWWRVIFPLVLPQGIRYVYSTNKKKKNESARGDERLMATYGLT